MKKIEILCIVVLLIILIIYNFFDYQLLNIYEYSIVLVFNYFIFKSYLNEVQDSSVDEKTKKIGLVFFSIILSFFITILLYITCTVLNILLEILYLNTKSSFLSIEILSVILFNFIMNKIYNED